MKIKFKLIIIAAVLLIFTVSVFCVFLNIQLSSTAGAMFDGYLSDLSKAQTASVQNYVNDVNARFETITKLPAIQRFTSGSYNSGSKEYDEAKSVIEALITESSASAAGSSVSGEITDIIIYDSSDVVVLGGKEDDLNKNALGICNTAAANNTPVVFSAEGNTKNTYNVTIKNTVNNLNVGVVFSDSGLSNIIKQAKDLVFIVDASGNIASANKQYGGQYGGKVLAQYQQYESFVTGASAAPTKCTVSDGTIAAYITASSNNWKVVAFQSVANGTKFSGEASGAVTGIAVTMLVVCLVVAVILIITVTKPFYKIQDTLLKISRGDHDARVEIMSKNEYGDIARVFNDIVDNIIVSESRYRTIIEMSDNIIFEWNLQTKEVTFSNNFNKKFSYRAPTDNFMDSFLVKCKVHPEDDERYKKDLASLEKGENFKHNEYRIKNIYGDYIWVLIRTASILDQSGEPAKIVGVIVDIDRSKKNEDVLTARASFDSLTGVYNRESIETVITNEIELIATRKVEFAILFIDIDDFKYFNDQYSHATGDQVLKFTATTIKNAVGEKGRVGRYGGDEFIVCIKEADSNDPAAIAENILNTLKAGFESDSGDRLTVNVSIGISIIRDNTKRVEELIGQADDAMYKIKKSGKSNFGFLET